MLQVFPAIHGKGTVLAPLRRVRYSQQRLQPVGGPATTGQGGGGHITAQIELLARHGQCESGWWLFTKDPVVVTEKFCGRQRVAGMRDRGGWCYLAELKIPPAITVGVDKQQQATLPAVQQVFHLQLEILNQAKSALAAKAPGKPGSHPIIPAGRVAPGEYHQAHLESYTLQTPLPSLRSRLKTFPSGATASTCKGILPRAWVAQERQGS